MSEVKIKVEFHWVLICHCNIFSCFYPPFSILRWEFLKIYNLDDYLNRQSNLFLSFAWRRIISIIYKNLIVIFSCKPIKFALQKKYQLIQLLKDSFLFLKFVIISLWWKMDRLVWFLKYIRSILNSKVRRNRMQLSSHFSECWMLCAFLFRSWYDLSRSILHPILRNSQTAPTPSKMLSSRHKPSNT